ncbi:hypothetical protein VTN77DRAFT_6029 [Rasamsonia byssochlamydoides]|uniref:uncharacterized protein n=1 Tax=Rasamsonia byssochlamydoides TaxID=89139 RepID=UPI0037421A09
MTRGNQREHDRKRAQKRQHEKGVGPKNTMSGTEYQRLREQQAAIMQEKQRRADERKAAEAAAAAAAKKK